jgi:D-ribose pyranase
MKRSGLINRDLSAIVAAMGHYDRLVVSDAGFPIPLDRDYVDLSQRPDQPTVLEIVQLLIEELQVEEVYVAEEAVEAMPTRLEDLAAAVPGSRVMAVPHSVFKGMAASARAIVRTGDFTPYANGMLVSGVVY